MPEQAHHILDQEDDHHDIIVGVLGEFLGRKPGNPWEPPASHRAARLGCVLAASPGRLVEKHQLMHALWPDDAPPTAANALQVYASQLRRILGKEIVFGNRLGYRLEVSPEAIDAHVFEERVMDGARAYRRVHLGRAASHFRSALNLWRGRPFQDMDRSAAEARSARLLEFRSVAVDRLLACEIELAAAGLGGSLTSCVAKARERVREDPFREAAQFNLIRALAVSGRYAEASLAFQEAQSILRDSMGMFAGPRLTSLHESVLRRDVSLRPLFAPHVGDAIITPASASTESALRSASGAVVDLHARLVTLVGLSPGERSAAANGLRNALAGDFPQGVHNVKASTLSQWVPPRAVSEAWSLCDLDDAGATAPPSSSILTPRAAVIIDADTSATRLARDVQELLSTSTASLLVLSDGELGLTEEFVISGAGGRSERQAS